MPVTCPEFWISNSHASASEQWLQHAMPPAGKLTAIFFLRIFAQRHCENAGKRCRINEKNN